MGLFDVAFTLHSASASVLKMSRPYQASYSRTAVCNVQFIGALTSCGTARRLRGDCLALRERHVGVVVAKTRWSWQNDAPTFLPMVWAVSRRVSAATAADWVPLRRSRRTRDRRAALGNARHDPEGKVLTRQTLGMSNPSTTSLASSKLQPD
jgi:hypothetical protein